ncbi:OLC1v1009901C1 [Oldenlandia corymbosa var. corymbosa]|uniref:OLC1v1009901C1 n=1 Tax=Oldenlandia corymbosa var. corymbosa TaxID=529605 RepID=A0AAV1DSE0_OLDCO|nr:OLC1v1009901C1 [Oldenlandia corymbosa var. corymbosa]
MKSIGCVFLWIESILLHRGRLVHLSDLYYSLPPLTINPRRPYDVSFIPVNYKRLRVLDLESINMGAAFASGIELLDDLRYLAVCGDMEAIPPSLANLENLETLLVKSFNDKGSSKDEIQSLISLSFPCFTCGKVADDTIKRFPNLRKLKCIVVKPRDSMVLSLFPAFESLCMLESLNISYYGNVLKAGEWNFPSSVKKLTLSHFHLPWNDISVIGRLQNLEVLKLKAEAFEGASWTMEEGEFLNLKYLKLDTLDIIHWDS